MSMELDHSFTVPVPPDRAWEVLLDVEGIAPCMPGATVEEFDGEVVTGRIKVKVGPVALTYRGTAKFTERDPDAKVIVLDASGKETRGAGTASAVVRASLQPSGEGTQVLIHTTMNVTGRPAQFGRGVIVEVGGKLIDKFAENLAQMISAGGASAGGETASVDAGTTVGADAASTGAATDEAGTGVADAGGAGVAATETTAAETTAGGVATAPATGPGSSQPVAAQTLPRTTPAPAAPDEDSINLLQLVGPAILKRVVPVVAAVAALALLGRRFRKARRAGRSKA